MFPIIGFMNSYDDMHFAHFQDTLFVELYNYFS